MNAARRFERVARAAVRRPALTVAVVALLALAGGLAALSLEPRAGTHTLVSRSSESFAATERFHERFGDDAVYVLVKGNLQKIVLTADLERVIGLEGCIAGNIPPGVRPPGGPEGPCGRLGAEKPVKVVYGPGTFIHESVRQIQQQLQTRQQAAQRQAASAGEAARKVAAARGLSKAQQDEAASQAAQLVSAQFVRGLAQAAVKYGIKDVPQINDPAFVSQLVFDPSRGYDQPKARFAYLFPRRDAALIQVRLKPELTDAQRRRAIALIREATAMPVWRLPRSGGSYTVTGAPVVFSDLSTSIARSIVVLLAAALLVMALTLALVFRTRARLLPLGIALAAAALTFGGMSLAGGGLTMASIAVLPVLIGLAVDYAIQFQARFEEAREGRGGEAVAAGGEGDPGEAAARAAAAGAPTIAIAAGATVAGFLVLQLSPVPMVRDFGLLLVIGVVVAFLCALTAGFAAMVLVSRGPTALPGPLRRVAETLAPAVRGAGEILGSAGRGAHALAFDARGVRWAVEGMRSTGRRALDASLRQPARVLGIALALAALGWVADTQTEVVSDVPKLVPQDSRALRDLESLQTSTGVSGEIDVMVRARDVTDPVVVRWMGDYQRELLERYRYSRTRPCGTAALCPAFSLPDLFQSAPATADRASIRATLDAVPPYFSQAVVSPDRRTATLAFGIRLMPLDEQQRIIEDMRERLDEPAGVRASLAGLPVLAAEANAGVSADWRRMATLVAGLLAVLAVLLAVWRRLDRALVPLLPIALATGWSALVLFLIRIPLNPMSVTLGALVIAISTEFSVLLSERYRQERAKGAGPEEALARTYRSTGAAVLASGITAIAGFGVLALSDIRMLRDFGLVTVVDLSVSLAGVLVVLPSVIVLAERGELLALPGQAARRAWAARPRARRPRAA